MHVTTSTGTLILNDDAIPSIDDMNEIIASVASDDDDFIRICDASLKLPPELTNAEFLAEVSAI